MAKTERKQKAAPAQNKLDAIGIESICERIADCETLQAIADSAEVSKGTLITWLAGHADQYARAREAQADKLAEDILAIADDGSNDTYKTEDGEATNYDVIARSRLRVDARKWLAGKMAPKKYGEKVAVGGAEDLPPVQYTKIERVIVRP
jgi:hypothetical protein